MIDANWARIKTRLRMKSAWASAVQTIPKSGQQSNLTGVDSLHYG
jgi:hypothetical protein